jgi:rhodanese-related sulfurtransferase
MSAPSAPGLRLLLLPSARAWREAALIALLALPMAALLMELQPRSAFQPRPVALTDGITMADASASPDTLWVDARGSAAFSASHLPGAVSIPMDGDEPDLAPLLAQWSPARLVVVYCSSDACDASRELAQRLRLDLGTQRVRYLIGGWDPARREARP